MWQFRARRRKRASTVTKHYVAHKELARSFIHERLVYWNQFYEFSYNRVAIRNQRRCWGSCSSNRNLNFSYKLLFVPPCLADYIVVHELCHLKEMNHGPNFWKLVEEHMPDYKERRAHLRRLEQRGTAAITLQEYAREHVCEACTRTA